MIWIGPGRLEAARRRARPQCFLAFGVIVGIGAHVQHVLRAQFSELGPLLASTAASVLAAMWCYLANNRTTFRDRRLRGDALRGALPGFVALWWVGLGAAAAAARLWPDGIGLNAVAASATLLASAAVMYVVSCRLIWSAHDQA